MHRPLLLCLLMTLVATMAMAEENRIWVPSEEFEVRFKGEAAEKFRGDFSDQGFRYTMSTPMGMMLTMFVEEAQKKGGSHEDVYKFYWEKSAKNPLIDPTTVKKGKQGAFIKVDYMMNMVDDGKTVAFQNSNIYFVSKSGKWIDVHVSYSATRPEINQLNKLAFEKTFEVK